MNISLAPNADFQFLYNSCLSDAAATTPTHASCVSHRLRMPHIRTSLLPQRPHIYICFLHIEKNLHKCRLLLQQQLKDHSRYTPYVSRLDFVCVIWCTYLLPQCPHKWSRKTRFPATLDLWRDTYPFHVHVFPTYRGTFIHMRHIHVSASYTHISLAPYVGFQFLFKVISFCRCCHSHRLPVLA